jgi:hypothetical protein
MHGNVNVVVRCHSGFRYPERPTSFEYAGSRHVISEILSQWKTETGYAFKVLADELLPYQLTYDEYQDAWQIKSTIN